MSRAENTAGAIVGTAMTALIGGAAAYFLWPSGVTDVPMAQLTMGAMLRAAGACALALTTLGIIWALWAR